MNCIIHPTAVKMSVCGKILPVSATNMLSPPVRNHWCEVPHFSSVPMLNAVTSSMSKANKHGTNEALR